MSKDDNSTRIKIKNNIIMKKQIVIAALTFGAIILGTSNVQAQKTYTQAVTYTATAL